MTKYLIKAKLTKWYSVPVEAEDEEQAYESLNDWIADDFEDFETQAQWDFGVEINE